MSALSYFPDPQQLQQHQAYAYVGSGGFFDGEQWTNGVCQPVPGYALQQQCSGAAFCLSSSEEAV